MVIKFSKNAIALIYNRVIKLRKKPKKLLRFKKMFLKCACQRMVKKLVETFVPQPYDLALYSDNFTRMAQI
jgi:hypothetical protein